MSQAEELLDTLTEETVSRMAGYSTYEPHIVIDRNRYIFVPAELRRIGVQYDHNVETVTFDCPRNWGGHDFTFLDAYIFYVRPDGFKGYYKFGKPTVDETDNNIIHFDWKVSREVTEVPGPLKISVCMRWPMVSDEPFVHWNTEINKDMFISEGLDCREITE